MKRWRVPEVVQTSLMDCGPAALKCVLEGHGIAVPYATIRERCLTDVDGTSIDALAALGAELGLEAHEVLVAKDSFLLPEADCLPAVVVTRSGAGALHFIVVWNVVGPFVQIMDPSSGRAWVRKGTLLERMADVELPIAETTWRAWAGAESGLAPLRARLRAVGAREADRAVLVDTALADPTWRSLGALDAAVRMVTSLVAGGALARGAEALRFSRGVMKRVAEGAPGSECIPPRFWWATAATAAGKLRLRGAVVVRFSPGCSPAPIAALHARTTERSGALPAAFAAALAAPSVAPLRLVADVAALDHPRAVRVLGVALAAAVVVTTLDALLFRGALEASRQLTLGYQRAGGIAALAGLTTVGLALEWLVSSLVHRVGRALEVRLRAGLLEKLPRLEDRYLQSRPTSDMAARGHAMQVLREIPGLAARVARASFTLVATVTGLVWIDPRGWAWAVLAACSAALLPYLLSRPLAERSMRMRTHASALDRFYLDALLGATPVRVHGAHRAVRREHESLLVDWSAAARSLHARTSLMQGVQLLVTSVFSVALVGSFVARSGATASLLLLVFWALRLSSTGSELALTFGALRDLRNVAARLFAPLGAPEQDPALPEDPVTSLEPGGVEVRFRAAGAGASGRTILRDVTVDIPAGMHVGVVGASGAGKSSLVGLLLGFLPVSEGSVEVDGAALDGTSLARLRRETAWVDPSVHLWNRSLLDNLATGDFARGALPRAMSDADLLEVVERLPEGMQTNLYEGGVRLSGGQGQRVRLARALLHSGSRLVLLDEPFRGMPRRQRQSVLRRARAHWAKSTLLLVSHDVSDTVDLDRVIVMEGGSVIEQGDPRDLLARDSHYRALVFADAALRTATWSKERWSQRSVVEGLVVEGADS